MGQVVDTETAEEFMAQTLEQVDVEELARIAADVEKKSLWFQEHVGPGMTREGFEAALGRVFSTRGSTRKTLLAVEWTAMQGWLRELLSDAEPAPDRLERFVGRLGDGTGGVAENLRIDFASELLHFCDPERHWLWTRWMWDPRTRTGALPLVTTAAYDLRGDRPGEVYMKVGRAVAFVHEVGEAAGFQRIGHGVFGTDVFLSCVYAVYTYTVLRMRMTKEFNKVMPGLPEFSRRLLGVHRP